MQECSHQYVVVILLFSFSFPQLFRHLEEHQDDLGVDSFGVSITTMEEVFLKVKLVFMS